MVERLLDTEDESKFGTDEFLDFLDQFIVRSKVSKENIR